jgi:hypothetical protein
MIDQLKTDFAAVVARLPNGPLVPASDVRQFLADELLPFVGSMLEEIDDIDATIAALAEGSEDVLHADSAAVFAALIVSGRALMLDLKKRVAHDPQAVAAVGVWMDLASKAESLLEDITLDEPEEGAESEEEEEPQEDDEEDPEDDEDEGP